MNISPTACRLSLAVAFTVLLGSAALEGQVLSTNLIFTSIQPCRVFDTRAQGVPLAAGGQRAFTVVGSSSDFAGQGGHPGGCGIPGFLSGSPQVQAVVINVIAVSPASTGDLRAWPSDQPEPAASILNYTAAEGAIANGVVIPVRQDQEGGDIRILSEGSATQVVGDVVGYFSGGGPGVGNLSLGIGAGNTSTSTGIVNTAVGDSALAANTTGTVNTSLGYQALAANTTGHNNTAAGTYSMLNNISGFQNTAIGEGALAFLSTGNSNVAIGWDAGVAYTGGESNNLLFGNVGTVGESNMIRIGGSQTQTFIAGIFGSPVAAGTTVFVEASGHLGVAPSSLRFKEDVTDMGETSDGLMQLRPVVFHYRSEYDDGSRLLQYGLIAEEVAAVFPGLVQTDKDGRPLLVRYQFVNAMVLNEVQKQHRTIDEQKTRIADLESRLATQRSQIEDQESRIQRLEAGAAPAPLP
jgi:hypothetical protein